MFIDMEQAMRIELASSAWKAEVIAIIRYLLQINLKAYEYDMLQGIFEFEHQTA